MDDDWGSPWADADDQLPSRLDKGGKVEAATKVKLQHEVIDVPGIPENFQSSIIGARDPWNGGDHGFGGSEAWEDATKVPTTTVAAAAALEDAFPVAWGTPDEAHIPQLPLETVKLKGEESVLEPVLHVAKEEQLASGEPWPGDGIHQTSIHPVPHEADAWGAGCDWSEPETFEKPDELRLEDSSDIVSQGKSLDVETVGLQDMEQTRYDSAEQVHEEEEEDSKQSGCSEPQYPIVGDLGPAVEPERDETPRLAESTLVVEELVNDAVELGGGLKPNDSQLETTPEAAACLTTECQQEESTKFGKSEKSEEDDDFGDFADEEEFEAANDGADAGPTSPVGEKGVVHSGLSSPIEFTVPTDFDIDVSLVEKLYPIPTSYPIPPPLDDIISSTEARKAWYRLSQSGTIRKNTSDDDDYVRVSWAGSKIQEDVNKIVSRWTTEDRISGGVVLGGGQRLGAMFGWGEGADTAENKRHSLSNPMSNLPKTNHSRHMSDIGSHTTKFQKVPFSIKSTSSVLAEKDVVSTPQAATFGWGTLDENQSTDKFVSSGSRPTTGRITLPSTPLRMSFDAAPLKPSRPNSPRPSAPQSPINPTRFPNSSVTHTPMTSVPVSLRNSPEALKTPKIDSIPTSELAQLGKNFAAHIPTVSAPVSVRNSQEVPKALEIHPTSELAQLGENLSTTKEESKGDASQNNPKAVAATPSKDSGSDEWGAFESLSPAKPVVDQGSPLEGWGSFETLGTTTLVPPMMGVVHTVDTSVRGSNPILSPSPYEIQTPAETVQSASLPINGFNTNHGEGGAKTTRDDWGFLESMGEAVQKSPVVGKSDPLASGSDNWGSFGAFEELGVESGASKPPESLALSQEPIPQASGTDLWGSLGAFEAPNQTKFPDPMEQTVGLTVSKEPAGIDNWGSFDAFEVPGHTLESPRAPKQAPQFLGSATAATTDASATRKPAIQDPLTGGFGGSTPSPTARGGLNISVSNSVIGNFGMPTSSSTQHLEPVLALPQTTGEADDDDDDDWGEMVQSPAVAQNQAAFSFQDVLRPSKASSFEKEATSPFGGGLNPESRGDSQLPQISNNSLHPTPLMSITESPSLFEMVESGPPAMSQQQASAVSANQGLSSTSGGGGDPWDLSFFDFPAKNPTVSNEAPSPQPQPPPTSSSQDLWDIAPAAVKPSLPPSSSSKPAESGEDRTVMEIVENLPDLSYILF